MSAIKNKLKSRRGASITFALLLFLVCAVVSSVVVVAGTTSSGWMSGLQEMDARYYALSDAGYLLCDIFDGESVTLEYVKEDYSVPTPPVGVHPILLEASKVALAGSELSRKAKDIKIGKTEGNNTEYSCSALEEFKNGLLTFTLSADGGNVTKGKYTLRLTFAPNVKKSVTDSSQLNAKATIGWKLRDIRRVMPTATAAPSP